MANWSHRVMASLNWSSLSWLYHHRQLANFSLSLYSSLKLQPITDEMCSLSNRRYPLSGYSSYLSVLSDNGKYVFAYCQDFDLSTSDFSQPLLFTQAIPKAHSFLTNMLLSQPLKSIRPLGQTTSSRSLPSNKSLRLLSGNANHYWHYSFIVFLLHRPIIRFISQFFLK